LAVRTAFVRALATVAMGMAGALLPPLAQGQHAATAGEVHRLQSAAVPQNSVLSQPVTPGSPATSSPATASTPLGAIFEYQGLPVREIRFAGVESGDLQQLQKVVTQKANQPLDRFKVRDSVRALFATGRFADIQVEADRTPQNEVTLVFRAVQNYFVGVVNVEGAPRELTNTQLGNASKLQLGELYTAEKLQTGIDRMGQLLQENGYYQATITESEQRDALTQQVNISFHVDPGAQARVGRITLTGQAGYSLLELLDAAHFHPGDRVMAQSVTSALRRLRKKYQKINRLEAQVSIPSQNFQPATNTVDYVLHVEPGPIVIVRVQGAGMRMGEIKKLIPVYEENAVDEDLVNEGRRNLRDYMQTRGYFDAEINVRQEFDEKKNERQIVYIVERGIRHKLTNIDISGNTYFDAATIRERMQVQPAGRLFSQGMYSQPLLASDVKTIEDLYRGNGFQQVEVTSAVHDNYLGQMGRIAVEIHVAEGPQTLVGSLHIAGNSTIPEDVLRANLSNVEGQPFSESNISADRDSILTYYFNNGFPDAAFEYAAKPAPGQPNRMDLTYTIREGQQFFVDRVLVDGLNYTRPYVVRRELQVHTGDPISQNQMYDSQSQLYNLGIFNEVDTAVQNPEGDVAEKNVLFSMKEARRYTFNYGFGFEAQTGQPAGPTQPQGETGVSPRVSFGVTRLNFRGRDHTISFKSHVGRLEQRALVSYDAPHWFNNDKLRFTLAGFYDNSLDVVTYTSNRLEGSAQIEQSWSKVTTTLYRFTYRRVQATNLVPLTPNLIPLLSQPVRVGIPSITYIRDKRDNPIESSRGNYTTVDAGVAAGFFGSQANFSRLLAQNATYLPFGSKRSKNKWVFARSTTVGVENQFGISQVVPLPERFLSGGGNTLRGFAINQAGPRDPSTGSPLGGEALFINNLELRTPPVSLPWLGNNMGFVVFNDAGNVFASPGDMAKGFSHLSQDTSQCTVGSSSCNFNYLSQNVGAGVRYKTPIGPLRFDVGYNLNPPVFPVNATSGDQAFPFPHVETGRHLNFFFSIGQTF
jgi:outer membrane protein insertion porin family